MSMRLSCGGDRTMTAPGPTGPTSPAGAPNVTVYPEALTTAAYKMYGLQDKVQGICDNLVENANALGQPWGDDDYGKQFASGPKGYLASRDAMVQGPSGALPATASWLQFFGDDMIGAAKAFVDAENSADEYFDPSSGSSGA
jgi:hypothetical protein